MTRLSRQWATDKILARIEQIDPLLNAFVMRREPEQFRTGRLGGLSYVAKDIFATPDRLPCGGLAHPLPPMDIACSDALRQLDEAGTRCFGYTALTEIAYEPSGYNAHGSVRNPWNFDFIPGGSSSGSAAAVASHCAEVALGSDTGGSLRIPAHCCGVTGWKPTWGAVSARGAMPLAPTLDTIGLLGQDAVAILHAARVLAPGDEAPSRSAVVIRDALAAAHPTIARACQDGIDAIETLGVTLEQRDAFDVIEACDEPVFTIMQGEAARCHRGLLDGGSIDTTLRRRLVKGLEIDDATLERAIARRPALAAAFVERVLQSADVAILPVMAIRTPPVAECAPNAATFRARTLYELSRFTRFVNMIGFPAVALPVGFDDRGMPVALQMVGRPGSDLTLLLLACDLQEETDWHECVPDAISALTGSERWPPL